ncbi:MAG: hypothetical protein J3K34DRAFT_404735 [Monoraphidium minutum]|nr:MAG: hypothetical protein J3K34DRAFT_404735 [Monoraphidium minutum]
MVCGGRGQRQRAGGKGPVESAGAARAGRRPPRAGGAGGAAGGPSAALARVAGRRAGRGECGGVAAPERRRAGCNACRKSAAVTVYIAVPPAPPAQPCKAAAHACTRGPAGLRMRGEGRGAACEARGAARRLARCPAPYGMRRAARRPSPPKSLPLGPQKAARPPAAPRIGTGQRSAHARGRARC